MKITTGRSDFYLSSTGLIELELSLEDAKSGSHQGDCFEDIKVLRDIPYIAAQLEKINPAELISELEEFGAWDEVQLSNHEDNLDRILWIACGDIKENSENLQ